MRFKITVLCENSVGRISGSLGEHGFAALVEADQGDSVLFDTGQGATLLHNAGRMNKNLTAVQRVVISHGHYDHAGGLMPLLRQAGSKQVFGHPGIFSHRFRQKDNGEWLDIGMPCNRSELESAGARFDLSKKFRQISPKIYLTGEVPRINDFEAGDLELYTDADRSCIDVVPDDQSLILETEKGLVVILGCCHSGIINTLDHIESHTGASEFYAVIGGTHLGFCSQAQLAQTVNALRRRNISKLAVSHCTGFQASAMLYRRMPKQFQIAMVGYSLEV